MTLPSTGVLSLSAIQSEFGGTTPISMSEYYANGGLVPSGAEADLGPIPTSGTLSASRFRGGSILPLMYGSLYSWGQNNAGQLGIGSLASKSSPVQVGLGSTWLKVASKNSAQLALKTDGTIWGAGLGTGIFLSDSLNHSTLMQIDSNSNWVDLYAGLQNTYLKKSDGTWWATGDNTYGQFGNSTTNVTIATSLIQVASDWTWTTFTIGSGTCAGIKPDGTLWVWGYNQAWGGLGIPDKLNKSSPVQIGTGYTWIDVNLSGSTNHILAVRSDGTLWSAGSGGSGNLGFTSTGVSSLTQVGTLTNWSKVFECNYSSFAIKTDGTFWSWGHNGSGQLGLNDITHRSSPVQVGSLTDWTGTVVAANTTQNSTLLVKANGTAWACGDNAAYQLGINVTGGSKQSFVQIGSLTTWKSIGSGTSCIGIHR